MDKNAKIISIINYKGGVGKTTSTFNIGVGLKHLANKKVLLIDLDPQCSLSTICLKALTRRTGEINNLKNLPIERTINFVIKKYLEQTITGDKPILNLGDLIIKNFYKGKKYNLDDIDVICATMFDDTSSDYYKGLDDLEIEIASYHFGDKTRLQQLTLFSRFFSDTNIMNEYDFILFDCPPANNLITQNALMISDYYLIPTIMDEMSSNGIFHFNSLIQNTLLNGFKQQYSTELQTFNAPFLDFIKGKDAKLLGVFETLKKTQVDTNQYRRMINRVSNLTDCLFEEVIYHHKDTAKSAGNGVSAFSIDLPEKGEYAPDTCYGNLIISILNKLNIEFNIEKANQRIKIFC